MHCSSSKMVMPSFNRGLLMGEVIDSLLISESSNEVVIKKSSNRGGGALYVDKRWIQSSRSAVVPCGGGGIKVRAM